MAGGRPLVFGHTLLKEPEKWRRGSIKEEEGEEEEEEEGKEE